MRIVTWTLRIALFVLLLAFAARNTAPVTVRFWLDQDWQAPLVLMLLAFFAAGALLGVTSALGALLRQRREILRLRRESRAKSAPGAAPAVPPPPAEG